MNKNRIYLYVMSVIIVFSAAYPALSVADIQTGFEFGNHIDTHQSTVLKTKNGEPVKLAGTFLVFFTGETDPGSGLPIARHPRGASQNELCGLDVD